MKRIGTRLLPAASFAAVTNAEMMACTWAEAIVWAEMIVSRAGGDDCVTGGWLT